MPSNLNLDYYYGTEAEQYSFYRIPKTLLTDPRYKSVSIEAKVLYGLLLNRMGLSVKNGWMDSNRRVYIYFTQEDAMNLVSCGKDKATKLFRELDKDGIGLIKRKKQGQGRLVCGGDPGRPKGQMRMNEMDRYRELIKENIDYDLLLTEHPYDEKTLDAFQKIVGGPIEAGCYLPQRVMLACNSEGKNMGLMPNRENPTDSRDFIAGTFLLCSFEGEHFASLSPAQQREFEAYFATSGPEGGDKD